MTVHRTYLPSSTIGMLGGGQLGRMFCFAAHTLGYRVIVFDNHRDTPAARVADDCIVAEFDDRHALQQFAEQCDLVTLEWENIPAEAVQGIEEIAPVFPSSRVLAIAQDRQTEKSTLSAAGLPVTPFRCINTRNDALQAGDELGFPFVLKTSRCGYDGKGQIRVDQKEAIEPAYLSLGSVPMVAEQWIQYRRELSVIVARNCWNETAVYPLMENHHANHILDLTLFPAEVDAATQQQARSIALGVAEQLQLVGLICVELFETTNGQLLINEIAPRPHNSGHVTIEAARTSQFEQHVRAICGLPLGDPAARCCGAMVNLLGQHWGNGSPDVVSTLRQVDTHLHLYGKDEVRHGRKMGHITSLADSLQQAREQAIAARELFTMTSP